MALRGVQTLAPRMDKISKNGFAVAKFLESHPMVKKVLYPGLPSHPQYEIAKTQMRGFAGMITFYIKGDRPQTDAFLSSLKVYILAESLGGVESLAECPAIMTHGSVPPEMRKELGIDITQIRLSCGVEDTVDLIADVDQALEKARKAKK